ncbi:aKG-HExxH-type peptide beta-hydroxylase [Xenorhabdus littoralis]|uniref:aKG-HExxH-type peptide beta-hydroxylase n=1 Tax=Xenorhabdus littoralis TaxID=2582835 RepID=UPI0029E7FFC5|nr:HEXXH motif-containing putative peptide modification protein [Xenorhabdus sp. psl]MDX7990351.1 hypothetical protein [Xenorhabdus sp. psl]
MTITNKDIFSIYLNREVIALECELWRKFVACNKKQRIFNFLTENHSYTSWSEKVVCYQPDNREDYQLVLKLVAVEMQRQNEDFSEIHYSAMNSYRENILEAIELLSTNSVVMDYTLRNLIGRVVIVSCDSLVATSSVLFLGLIVISPKENWTLSDYVENIIHEMSHIELYIKQLLDPLVSTGTYLKSPFRDQPRPANGVFHAAFVLTRIVFYMHNLTLSGADKLSTAANLNKASLLLKVTLAQFHRKNLLTIQGRSMAEEMGFVLSQFQKEDSASAIIYK